MMRTMSYQPMELSSLATHSHSQAATLSTSPDPQPAKAGSSCFKNCLQHSADCRSSAATVKEEPLEEEGNKEIVIDLTPDDLSSPLLPQEVNEMSERHVSVRHNPYSCPSVKENELLSNLTGNVPFHLKSSDNFNFCSSDSEISAKDESKKALNNQTDMLTGTFRFSIPKDSIGTITQPRAKREFVPEIKKDESYWNKRHKNNLSARFSRIKRKTMEKLMAHRMVELEQENIKLKYELEALKRMFGDKLTADLSSSPSQAPASSRSSGVGTLNSNLSSSGSAEHSSTSSSPILNSSDSKTQKAPFQLTAKQAPRGTDDAQESSKYQGNYYSPPTLPSRTSPPVAHRNTTLLIFNGISSYGMQKIPLAPPAAHSSTYGVYSQCSANNFMNNPTNPVPALYGPAPFTHWHRPVVGETCAQQNPPSASFPNQSYREYFPQNHSSSCSSESSPGPSSSPSGVATSEDDSSIGSDSRRNSRSDQDEESLQKVRCVPLKWRFMKDIPSFSK